MNYRNRRLRLTRNQRRIIIVAVPLVVLILLVVMIAAVARGCSSEAATAEQTAASVSTQAQEETKAESFQIQNVKVIKQDDLKAGCETYACTMLLNILGFNVTQYDIADNYLNCQYVFDDGENKYGPDMYSAFAGTAYGGWGVYAPSMAKSMNKYLADQKSKLKAYNQENIPLETLCDEYVSKGVPVMVWATTDMEEPYVYDTWIVNYVDENARTKMGDTFNWYMHEHCLVLIGYDDSEYYFADSTHGNISHFEKELAEERYEQMGKQAIVVK